MSSAPNKKKPSKHHQPAPPAVLVFFLLLLLLLTMILLGRRKKEGENRASCIVFEAQHNSQYHFSFINSRVQAPGGQVAKSLR